MKTLAQIKDEVAIKRHNCTFIQSYLLISVLKYDDLINEAMELYLQQTVDMYKECLETFLPTDKWDEATEFLSSYGSGLAKDLQRREK